MSQDIVRFQSATEMLSSEQAAKLLGVSRNTIRRYHRQGILPSYTVGKRLLRFRRDDLLALVSRTDRSA